MDGLQVSGSIPGSGSGMTTRAGADSIGAEVEGGWMGAAWVAMRVSAFGKIAEALGGSERGIGRGEGI